MLSQEQRITIILRYFATMTVEDVAWATKVPIGTTKSRLNADLAKIRKSLVDTDDA